jgi:hypothetical protein
MSRGLSRLQRWILSESRHRGQLYQADILERYFGWSSDHAIDSERPPRFSSEAIGRRQYHKVRVTLSRACLRLQQRGLLTCLQGPWFYGASVVITHAGREWLRSHPVQVITSKGRLPSA